MGERNITYFRKEMKTEATSTPKNIVIKEFIARSKATRQSQQF